mmetsp:Transcript_73943/g.209418  ORF Transcript_73943/g.209418 Transcript_73943/m.209418 type:complete len:328 (+) Transcript_73943:461-1444(+)
MWACPALRVTVRTRRCVSSRCCHSSPRRRCTWERSSSLSSNCSSSCSSRSNSSSTSTSRCSAPGVAALCRPPIQTSSGFPSTSKSCRARCPAAGAAAPPRPTTRRQCGYKRLCRLVLPNINANQVGTSLAAPAAHTVAETRDHCRRRTQQQVEPRKRHPRTSTGSGPARSGCGRRKPGQGGNRLRTTRSTSRRRAGRGSSRAAAPAGAAGPGPTLRAARGPGAAPCRTTPRHARISTVPGCEGSRRAGVNRMPVCRRHSQQRTSGWTGSESLASLQSTRPWNLTTSLAAWSAWASFVLGRSPSGRTRMPPSGPMATISKMPPTTWVK